MRHNFTQHTFSVHQHDTFTVVAILTILAFLFTKHLAQAGVSWPSKHPTEPINLSWPPPTLSTKVDSLCRNGPSHTMTTSTQGYCSYGLSIPSSLHAAGVIVGCEPSDSVLYSCDHAMHSGRVTAILSTFSVASKHCLLWWMQRGPN